MAEEKEAKEGSGAEFPVFKASEGAFDRAKYEEQSKARVTTDGVNVTLTGKEIDEDLKKKKVSAEDAAKKATKFYDESYDRNLKDLSPAIERGGVYYDNAYSGAQSDKSKIRRRIDKGEALDGKEIFEMSKDAAKNKIGNIEILKKGKVTEIVENLGFKNIKEFDLYEDVKEDFDSKIKDDKLKFEPLLTKISSLLSYFNDDSPMASQNYMKLYTTENKAILAALAKILEGEGFDNDMVKEASKNYNKHMLNLIEKDKGGSIDNMKMDKEGNIVSATGGTGATGTTSEQKLEEKKQEKATGDNKGSTGGTSTSPTGKAEESKIESATSTTSTNIVSNSPTTGAAASSSVETLNKKSDAVSTEGAEKKEEAKNNETKKEGTKESKVEGADSAYDKLLSEMGLGSLNKSKEGEKEVKDKGKEGAKEGAKSETSKEGLKSEKEESKSKKDEKAGSGDKSEKIESSDPYDKLLSELGLGFLNKGKGTSDNKDSGKSDKTPIKETKESKIEEKSTTPSKSVETSPTSTPIKETQAQNLSSVSTPEPDKNKTENTQTPTASTASSTTQTPMSSVSTTSTTEETKTISESQSEANKKSEEKKSKEESDSMNKEMSDNIKTMVNLLTQLNSTLQNPLVVIPNKKNFV